MSIINTFIEASAITFWIGVGYWFLSYLAGGDPYSMKTIQKNRRMAHGILSDHKLDSPEETNRLIRSHHQARVKAGTRFKEAILAEFPNAVWGKKDRRIYDMDTGEVLAHKDDFGGFRLHRLEDYDRPSDANSGEVVITGYEDRGERRVAFVEVVE